MVRTARPLPIPIRDGWRNGGHVVSHVLRDRMLPEFHIMTTKTEPVEITFHADNPYATAHPAIRVKLWDIPGARSTAMRPESVDTVLDSFLDVSEADRQYAWDLAVKLWWVAAEEIATERGYDNVTSEGRSGGWCLPVYRHERGYIVYPDCEHDARERERFVAFRAAINDLLTDFPAMLQAELEALAP